MVSWRELRENGVCLCVCLYIYIYIYIYIERERERERVTEKDFWSVRVTFEY
jgi:hypothetical protein